MKELELIKEYFEEKYKRLDEMTEIIQNTESNPFQNKELEDLDTTRRMLEDVESELEEWIQEHEEND